MTGSADWHDFATMIGGASGALTGLLFVAVSLNASRIAGHPGLRASAGQTLTLFITPLVIAAALLVPHQPDWVLGAELTATGLFSGLVLSVNHRVKTRLADDDLRLISIFNRRTPNVIAMGLVMASGVILTTGQEAGLYLLFPAMVVELVSGVLNAWYFLLPPPGGRPSRTVSALTRRRDRPASPDTSPEGGPRGTPARPEPGA
ncbi:MAG TPA: hypothetical protein VGG16_01740 [Streptosporangiaceae bacterium]|jgi:modulator of FtsH protease